MAKVFCIAHNIISPLGTTSAENFAAIRNKKSGISLQPTSSGKQQFLAKITSSDAIGNLEGYSFFETIVIRSIQQALSNSTIATNDSKVLFVFSSTKGNIAALNQDEATVNLQTTAQKITTFFKNPNPPIIVNQACVSGISAIGVAHFFLQSETYSHAIVIGADVLSDFVVSGFEALGAASAAICRPFDKERKGINLGEAAATMVLSNTVGEYELKSITATNDANHISGPSRSGEELAQCLQNCMIESELKPTDIGFVCLHGTATLYNDEMEAKAMNLAGLSEVPSFSLKGYFGHTLGASGILETIIGIMALENEIIPASLGYESSGVSQSLAITTIETPITKNSFIKSAAGFGGCNASLIIFKHNKN